MRGDVDITGQVRGFNVLHARDGSVELTLDPPQPTDDVTIYATYAGKEYEVYPGYQELED